MFESLYRKPVKKAVKKKPKVGETEYTKKLVEDNSHRKQGVSKAPIDGGRKRKKSKPTFRINYDHEAYFGEIVLEPVDSADAFILKEVEHKQVEIAKFKNNQADANRNNKIPEIKGIDNLECLIAEAEEIPKEISIYDLLKLIPEYDCFHNADDYYFDIKAAQKAIDFIQGYCIFAEGEKINQPFLMEPWQIAIVTCLFGWYHKKTNLRRYKEVLLYVPRKNGKTPLVAAIMTYMLFCDKESIKGAQLYAAAADKDQAAIMYRHMGYMIRKNPAMAAKCKIYKNPVKIIREEYNTLFAVLSGDDENKHGLNVSCAAIDELHIHKNEDLINTLTTGTASRSEALIIFTTTAATIGDNICNKKLKYAKAVRRASLGYADGIDDPTLLPIIYEIMATTDSGEPIDVDWTNPELWKKANPNLGVSVQLSYLETECKKALADPTKEAPFKQLHLNMQTPSSNVWIPAHEWDACPSAIPLPEELKSYDIIGRAKAWRQARIQQLKKSREPGYLAFDLSSVEDLTSATIFFPKSRVLLPFFWLPGDSAVRRQKEAGVPYVTWCQSGFIRKTVGRSIDHEEVFKTLKAITQTFKIKRVCADFYNSDWIQSKMESLGIEVVDFGMTYRDHDGPARTTQALVLKRELDHGENPVLRWCILNVHPEVDNNGLVRLSKTKSREKIDGAITAIQSIGLAHVSGEDLGSLDNLVTTSRIKELIKHDFDHELDLLPENVVDIPQMDHPDVRSHEYARKHSKPKPEPEKSEEQQEQEKIERLTKEVEAMKDPNFGFNSWDVEEAWGETQFA